MPSTSSTPTASTSRHLLPDPATSVPSSRLRLEVLDVTSTAVALSVFTPPLPTTPGYSNNQQQQPAATKSSSASLLFRKRTPVISIQLDGQPWSHVAHAGSLSQESTSQGGRGAETTVIVYGLVPGREYEISLDVTTAAEGDEQETESFSLEVETGQEGKLISLTSS